MPLRSLLLALVAAAVALVAGCAPLPVTPAPGQASGTTPAAPSGSGESAPLPALATLNTTVAGKAERIDLVSPAGKEWALEVLRQSGGAWSVAARSPSVSYKQGVGRYVLERRDLPGHPGAIVAGQAPYIFAFDAETLEPLDYAQLAAPAAPGPGTQIVVDKGINILYLFKDGKLVKYYHVGTFVITTKTVNPAYSSHGKTWQGGDPDNPLGTRWLGFPVLKPQGKQVDTGLIWAIHGTNEPDKIGTYVSDGCIRMLVPDVEELFPQVPVGTHLTIIDTFPVTA